MRSRRPRRWRPLLCLAALVCLPGFRCPSSGMLDQLSFNTDDHLVDEAPWATHAETRLYVLGVPDELEDEVMIGSTDPAVWSVAWLEAPSLASLRAVGPGSATLEVRDGDGRLVDGIRMQVAEPAALTLGVRGVVFFPTPYTWFPYLAETDVETLRMLEESALWLHLAIRDAEGQPLGGTLTVTADLDGDVVREVVGPAPRARDGEAPPDPLPLATNRLMRMEVGAAGASRMTLTEPANGVTTELAVEVVPSSAIDALTVEVVDGLPVDEDDDRLVGGTLDVRLFDEAGRRVRGGRCSFTDQRPGTIDLETFDEPGNRCLAIFQAIVAEGVAEVLVTEEATGLTTTVSFEVGTIR